MWESSTQDRSPAPSSHLSPLPGRPDPSMPTDQFPALRPTQVKLRLSSGPEAVSLARHCLDDYAADLGHALFEDMRLLISELMTNAVRHASPAGDGTLTVELSVGTDLVRACVTDPGPGFEATPREPGRRSGLWLGPLPRRAALRPLGSRARRRHERLVRDRPPGKRPRTGRIAAEGGGYARPDVESPVGTAGLDAPRSSLRETGSRESGRYRGAGCPAELQDLVGAVDHVEALGHACDLEHALNDLGSLDDHHAAVVLIAA